MDARKKTSRVRVTLMARAALHIGRAVTVGIVAGACTQEPEPSSITVPLALRYARSVDTQSRAIFTWADSVNVAVSGVAPNWVAAGIRGDGRDKYGQPALTSEHEGDFCGVSAFLGDTYASLNADVDFYYTSTMAAKCGSSRKWRFYFDSASTPTYTYAPHVVVMYLGTLSVGQSMSQADKFGINQRDCDILEFDDAYPPANNFLIIRLPDVAGANGMVRQWRIQSQGSHRAMCIVRSSNGGKLINTGVSHFLPFSYTLTEVPYPFPTYP